ncbi:MAG: glycosyltransferase [Nostocaceae cyanobacterium]|nr:glycosyltransferase [Nostocaceae cyanobacterium]
MNKIPKIIHQVFFSGEAAIPENYRRYSQTVKEHHPHWEHVFWDETKARKFMEENYSWFLSVFDSYPYPIQRFDAIRYFILHYYGGFYVDMDIECLKPIDDLLEGFELVLSKAYDAYSNAIMGSVPGHPVWLEVFEGLKKRQDRSLLQNNPLKNSMPYYVSYSTGPVLLSDCVLGGKFHKRPEVRSCPSYIFEPNTAVEIDGKFYKLQGKQESYTIHHMTSHWVPLHQKIFTIIFDFLAKPYWSLRSLRTLK